MSDQIEEVRAFWETKSVPYEPTPGVYALYQRDTLKYIGQSADCCDRLHHQRTPSQGLKSLEKCDAWETGVPFTARVMELPESDEETRREWEHLLIIALNPPCNTQRGRRK